MPRDLSREAQSSDEGLSPLQRSPDDDDRDAPPGSLESELVDIMSQANPKRDQLHPYTQTLKVSDLESCALLEEQTFPESERASREKFQYRLSKCGELSLGIFTSHAEDSIATAGTAAPVYSGAPERKSVLLGHIVGTKTTSQYVTDDDMKIPSSDNPDPKLGHKEEGRTVCIHSLAVLPQYQKRGLGKTLVMAYVQRMEQQGVADRLALIAHEELIPYYESLGFENQGKSDAQFGGGGWFSMIRELRPEKELMEEEVFA